MSNAKPFEIIQAMIMGKKEPERVQLSKEAFERAIACRQFLWDVPADVLAWKGFNQIVDLMLAVLKDKIENVTPLAMLADEAQAYIGVLSGTVPGYTPRRELEKQNEDMRAELLKKFFFLDAFMSSPRGDSDVFNSRDRIGRLLAPCMECQASGVTLVEVTGNTFFGTTHGQVECPNCNGTGFNRAYFDSIKQEKK